MRTFASISFLSAPGPSFALVYVNEDGSRGTITLRDGVATRALSDIESGRPFFDVLNAAIDAFEEEAANPTARATLASEASALEARKAAALAAEAAALASHAAITKATEDARIALQDADDAARAAEAERDRKVLIANVEVAAAEERAAVAVAETKQVIEAARVAAIRARAAQPETPSP